ncbi:MAG: hypothetical protein R3300_09200 [Candidatus Promineifilaceae bacterium]|nr:hypothetical protein [Candidatus Promineifilaceae bacterium]
MLRKPYLVVSIAVLLLLSACTGAATDQPTATVMDATMVTETEAMDPGQASSEEPAAGSDSSAVNEQAANGRPDWQTAVLTNARTGDTFTLADFAGQAVFVEPMATWCTNCRRQLMNVRQAQSQLSGEEVVFVALSVETNIGPGDLANYANDAGFDWLFAVATPELLQQLVDQFGRAITTPPATPHFIIRPDGTFTDLTTGIESADQLVAQLAAARE